MAEERAEKQNEKASISIQASFPSGEAGDAVNKAKLVYILQAVSFILVITYFAGIIINYLKKDEVKGTLAESHFRWQIRTFWFSVLWSVIGIVLTAVFIGIPILLANSVWVIYRIIKGWINLSEGKPMYAAKEPKGSSS